MRLIIVSPEPRLRKALVAPIKSDGVKVMSESLIKYAVAAPTSPTRILSFPVRPPSNVRDLVSSSVYPTPPSGRYFGSMG